MCLWKVKAEDRHCEYCTYKDCKPKPPAEEVFGKYAVIMNGIIGRNVLDRSRETALVWARNMVAYQMRMDGYTTGQIGRCLGMDHSTVSHGSSKVEDMMKYPNMFSNEMSIWKRFQKEILNS